MKFIKCECVTSESQEADAPLAKKEITHFAPKIEKKKE